MRKGGKGGSSRSNGLLPNSLRIISSCLKTVSTNATTVASSVRSAGASVAASVNASHDDQKDQVLWAGFDKLELGPSAFKHVLLLGYSNGFQVLDVEDASNVSELVSKRDGPVTFLQMQPIPVKSDGHEGFGASQPLLLVVAGDETNNSGVVQSGGLSSGLIRDGNIESQTGNSVSSPTVVRFYSLKSHSYVHVLRFRSAVYAVRCSPRIVAVGLAAQIYCFDALTLENKFSVLTYPVPQLGGKGMVGINFGYGAMAVGPRWLAYASNSPMRSNMGRLSPQNLTPSPGVSPSTSPGNGTLVARYAMESSKHLAAGIINLSDMGYKTLSKYYQELLPDGSIPPNSTRKVGRLGSVVHSSETDNAGMVVVKDFVSRAVVSQFRAHTSPISALCFDPSGTLLVTTSVHGNNINIFRIMPSLQTGSNPPTYDWNSSHVHLYKLYRGMTTAVIQDICFSPYSQWVAIVSSRGTCHIYVLSPFGGDTGLQTQNSDSDGPTLLPGLSLPWWSTYSCATNQQSSPPPAAVSLSVVSRIKNGNSGWLNTVSNAAGSAAGKVTVPTGAVAVSFHNSLSRNLQSVPVPVKSNALEHLLVYTPSGHVIQHKLLPSLGVEPSDSGSRISSGSFVQIQEEELRVKVEPAQWWYVCRKSNWPEREESISGVAVEKPEDTSTFMAANKKYSAESKNSIVGNVLVKPHERPHWYVSNAEVQISSGSIPIWQKSKISFQMMVPMKMSEKKFTKDYTGGEVEIEKILVQEVEIKRKDLLPVFDHFHNTKPVWDERGLIEGTYPRKSFYQPTRGDKSSGGAIISHSNPKPFGSVKNSDTGSLKPTKNALDFDQIRSVKSSAPINQTTNLIDGKEGGIMLASPVVRQISGNSVQSSSLLEHSNNGDSEVVGCVTSSLSSLSSSSLCAGGPISEGTPPSSNISDVSNASSGRSCLSLNILEEGTGFVGMHDSPDLGQHFQEEYCKVAELDECHKFTEVVPNADNRSSHCKRKEPDGDDEDDDILGGVFCFSEG